MWYKQGESRRWWEVEQSKNGGSMFLTKPEGVVGAHMDPLFFDCCPSHHLRLFPCFTFCLDLVQVAIFTILQFSVEIFWFLPFSVTQPIPISPNFTKPMPAAFWPMRGLHSAGARAEWRRALPQCADRPGIESLPHLSENSQIGEE